MRIMCPVCKGYYYHTCLLHYGMKGFGSEESSSCPQWDPAQTRDLSDRLNV